MVVVGEDVVDDVPVAGVGEEKVVVTGEGRKPVFLTHLQRLHDLLLCWGFFVGVFCWRLFLLKGVLL